MSDRAHVSSGCYVGAETGTIDLHSEDYELLDLDLHRLEHDFLLLPRQLIGRDAVNLFRGEWRRSLFDDSTETGLRALPLLPRAG